jgi:hypothetical protein
MGATGANLNLAVIGTNYSEYATAPSRRSLWGWPPAAVDPQPTFMDLASGWLARLGSGHSDKYVESLVAIGIRPSAEPGSVLVVDAVCRSGNNGSCQFFEQRLSLFQIGGIKSLSEPSKDRGEEVARFGASALLSP